MAVSGLPDSSRGLGLRRSGYPFKRTVGQGWRAPLSDVRRPRTHPTANDFNGDHISDILSQNQSNGVVGIWNIDRATVASRVTSLSRPVSAFAG